jgi:hypothetical protein
MTGIELIAAERQRQQAVEGWTPEHDRHHSGGELARAATAYLTRIRSWWPGNLAPACGRCNSAKKDQVPGPWVDRGMAALPDLWIDLVALALEHVTDEWLDIAA